MRDLENIQLTGEEEAKLQYDYIEKAKKYVAEKVAEKGRPLTFCVTTFGCQMNDGKSVILIILSATFYFQFSTNKPSSIYFNTLL